MSDLQSSKALPRPMKPPANLPMTGIPDEIKPDVALADEWFRRAWIAATEGRNDIAEAMRDKAEAIYDRLYGTTVL